MNIDQFTVLDLFYVALAAVGTVYFAVAAIGRALENRHAHRRRR